MALVNIYVGGAADVTIRVDGGVPVTYHPVAGTIDVQQEHVGAVLAAVPGSYVTAAPPGPAPFEASASNNLMWGRAHVRNFCGAAAVTMDVDTGAKFPNQIGGAGAFRVLVVDPLLPDVVEPMIVTGGCTGAPGNQTWNVTRGAAIVDETFVPVKIDHAVGSRIYMIDSPGYLTDRLGDLSVTASAGLLAARPAAGAVANGYMYFASDVNGGTVYISDGIATWTKAAPGASEVSGTEVAHVMAVDTFHIVAAATGTAVPVGNGTVAAPSMVVAQNLLRPTWVRVKGYVASLNTAAKQLAWQIVDETGAILDFSTVRSTKAAAGNDQVVLPELIGRIPAGGAGHTYTLQAWVVAAGGAVGDITNIKMWAELK